MFGFKGEVMDILKELGNIGREIEQATADKNQAMGAKANIVSSITKNYGVETAEEIEAKIEEMVEELETIGTKIETKFKDLQENYSWEE
jgi:chorismate synthase